MGVFRETEGEEAARKMGEKRQGYIEREGERERRRGEN